jgi:hypothetical protein
VWIERDIIMMGWKCDEMGNCWKCTLYIWADGSGSPDGLYLGRRMAMRNIRII